MSWLLAKGEGISQCLLPSPIYCPWCLLEPLLSWCTSQEW